MKTMLKVFCAFLFLGLLVARPTASYAYWHHDHGYVGVSFGVYPRPYYYGYDPYYPYYDPYYAAAPAYTVVASSSYQPVVVNGTTYYLNNGVYYIYTQYGYQAVAAPAGAGTPVVQSAPINTVAASADADSGDTFTVNIPNAKGGFTAVVLKKSGTGFIGPQGEFYAEFPKVAQLQAMYGK